MKKSLKANALAHYDRMIAWASKQNKRRVPDTFKMRLAIGETASGYFCPYCIKYDSYCKKCPLFTPNTDNVSDGCCNGLWRKMNDAKTWGLWLVYAKKVRAYIEVHG